MDGFDEEERDGHSLPSQLGARRDGAESQSFERAWNPLARARGSVLASGQHRVFGGGFRGVLEIHLSPAQNRARKRADFTES